MVCRNVIRVKRLNVDNDSPAIFQYTNTFIENSIKCIVIIHPECGIVMVAVIKTKIIRRRCNDDVYTIIRQPMQDFSAVATDDAIRKVVRKQVVDFAKSIVLSIIIFTAIVLFRFSINDFAFRIIIDELPFPISDCITFNTIYFIIDEL